MGISNEGAVILAAGIPAAITALATVYVAKVGSGLRAKVNETHHQVTVNGHSSEAPTILDRLAEVAAAVEEVRADVGLTNERLDDHLRWSEQSTTNLWRAVWYAFRRGYEHAAPTEENDTDVPE